MVYVKKRFSIINLLFLAIGVFSTLPVVTLNIFGRMISYFTILLVFVVLYLIYCNYIKHRNMDIDISRTGKYYLFWMFFSIISCIFGTLYFSDNYVFKDAPYQYLPKILIYIVLFILFCGYGVKDEYMSSIIKGVFIGACINCLWAIIDGLVYYSFGLSINNIVFAEYIQYNGIRYGQLSLITSNGYRAGGFNYDPAHIGLCGTILCMYGVKTKRIRYVVVACMAFAMAQSTLGIISSAIIILISLVASIRNVLQNKMEIKIKNIVFIGFVFFALMIVFYFISLDSEFLINAINRLLSKFVDGAEQTRITYISKLPECVAMFPAIALIGTGYGTASYPYLESGVLSWRQRLIYAPYDPENNYVSYLFDCGIVGLVCYLVMIYLIIKNTSRFENNDMVVKLQGTVVAIFITGFFYHYTLHSMAMMVFMAGIIFLRNNNSIKNSL